MAINFTYPQGQRRAMTFSYDDGMTSDRRLVDIFNKYDVKGTFHLNSSLLGKAYSRIELDELTTLFNGHEIACHSSTHPFLETLPREAVISEILADRKTLERSAGYPVVGLSYPYGTYSPSVKELIKALGIVYARTTQATMSFKVPDDFLAWHPTCHHKHDIMTKLESFVNAKHPLALFYIWGHSHEFDNDNNWDIIEQFCEKAGADASIWHATNIEIFDYLHALKLVRLSVDGDRIRNLSALSVWIDHNGKSVELPPGETINL